MSGEEPSEKRSKVPVKLGYWKIRGLAQCLRLLLKYTGIEFEDILYEKGPAPDYSCESWFSIKFTLGLDFPNLPYLIDGDVKITQSKAIMHYIARKGNLCGNTEAERIAVEMVEGVVGDLSSQFINTCHSPKYAEMRPDMVKKAAEVMKQLSDYLGKKKWFAGEVLTYVDFYTYEMLEVLRMFEAELYNNDISNLTAFLNRFEQLPAIQEYMKSSEFLRRPVYAPNALWQY